MGEGDSYGEGYVGDGVGCGGCSKNEENDVPADRREKVERKYESESRKRSDCKPLQRSVL